MGRSERDRRINDVARSADPAEHTADREQGGRKLLEDAGYRLHAVFTLREVLEALLRGGAIDQARFDEVSAYLESA